MLFYCTNTACSDPNHKHSIEKLYGIIVGETGVS